jgi:hypothetical protein
VRKFSLGKYENDSFKDVGIQLHYVVPRILQFFQLIHVAEQPQLQINICHDEKPYEMRAITLLYHYFVFVTIILIVVLLPISALAYGEVFDFGKSRISIEIPHNFEPIELDSNESQTKMRWLDDSTNSYLTIVSEYGEPSLPISLAGPIAAQQNAEKGTLLEYSTIRFGHNYSGFTFTLEGSSWPDPIYDVPVREVLVFTQDNGVNYGIALISPVEDFEEASKVIQDILDSFEILDKSTTQTITA